MTDEIEVTDNRRLPAMRRTKFRRWESPNDFWTRIQKPVGCWLYGGAKEINGYGYLRNPIDDNPKYITAHKLAWILTHGPVPEGMSVLHTCDVRSCCNPEHLFLGSVNDNHVDMYAKDRHMGKLRAPQVREIREALKTPYRGIQRDLAKKYNVTHGVIHKLKKGESYGFVK